MPRRRSENSENRRSARSTAATRPAAADHLLVTLPMLLRLPQLRARAAQREAAAACRCMRCVCQNCQGDPNCPTCGGARSTGLEANGEPCGACQGRVLSEREIERCSDAFEASCELRSDVTRCPKRRRDAGLGRVKTAEAWMQSCRQRGLPAEIARPHLAGALPDTDAVHHVRGWLAGDAPVLSLVGPPGIGKHLAASLLIIDRGFFFQAALAESELDKTLVGRVLQEKRLVVGNLHPRLSVFAWRRIEGLVAQMVQVWGRTILVGTLTGDEIDLLLPLVASYPQVSLVLAASDAAPEAP